MSSDDGTQPQGFSFLHTERESMIVRSFVPIYLLSSDSSINFPFQVQQKKKKKKSIAFESAFFEDCKGERLHPSALNVHFNADGGPHCSVSDKQH